MMNDMVKEGDMKGANDKRLVPELRFPEFKKDWGKNVLRAIIKTITPPKKLQTTEYHKKGIYPIIDQSKIFICGLSDDESALVNKKKEDVVIFGDHTCILKLANFSFIQGADGIKIFKSSDPSIVRTGYIYQYLKAFPIGLKEYKRHYSELKEIIVCYPYNIIEQEKIAECLSSIDEEISAMKEKVEQLKIYKKGLMQKLFPAAGKFLPELRFPEFKNDGGWKKVILGEAFERISEKNVNNNRNVLTISAQYGLVSQYDYFNKNVAAANIKNYYFIHKGDFAYNKSRSQGYPFGVIKPLRRYDSGVVSTLYVCFRAKINCCIDFYEQYFDTDLINDEISKIAQEGARNHGLLNISIDDFFNKIKILVPHSSEQQKIAECLSFIDELISLYENKVTLLEQHKKGLMQQLFPKL